MKETKPKLKFTVKLLHIGTDLHFCSSGHTTIVSDPLGQVASLCSLMDGSRPLSEISQVMIEKYPELSSSDVEGCVSQFDEIGFLEDADQGFAGHLDEYDVSRWQRNINFFGSFTKMADNKYAMQAKIKNAKVALLGLGGLGSHLLFDLAALGVQNIRAAEFDRVEISNLNRQILYKEDDLGELKSELAAKRIKEFSPRLNFEVRQGQLLSAADVREVIRGTDCVICVADRPKTKIHGWVNEACVLENIPLITGGLDTQRAVYYSMIPSETGCIECWKQKVREQDPLSKALMVERERIEIAGDQAAFVPFISMLTGLMVSELVRLVTGIAPPAAAGRMHEMYFDTMTVQLAETWNKNQNCPLCHGLPRQTKPQSSYKTYQAA